MGDRLSESFSTKEAIKEAVQGAALIGGGAWAATELFAPKAPVEQEAPRAPIADQGRR